MLKIVWLHGLCFMFLVLEAQRPYLPAPAIWESFIIIHRLSELEDSQEFNLV